MNPNQAMSLEENNVVELCESPGRRLRVQRQSRGLELERIAAQLHLRTAIVEALEQDRYEALPAPVFVAGYLRNYARLLGMDPLPLIVAYHAASPNPEPAAPRLAVSPRREIGSGHILMRLISLTVLAAAIGMLVLWWQNRADLMSDLLPREGTAALAPAPGEGATPPADSAPAGGLPIDALPVAASPAIPGSEPPADVAPPPSAGLTPPADEPPAPVPGEAPAASGPSDGAAPSPAPAQPAATDAPPDRQVALSFSGPCWIEVRDAADNPVLSGKMRKGDRHVLEGQPPFSFKIGNARVTAITVGGKPFDLTGVSRGGVARFKLDPAGAE